MALLTKNPNTRETLWRRKFESLNVIALAIHEDETPFMILINYRSKNYLVNNKYE